MRLLILILVAMALRFGFVFGGLPLIERHVSLRYDADDYGAIAQSIWRGEWRDIQRGPAYPLFVAACGGSLTAIRIIQVLLDTATVFLLFRLGQRLWDERIGLIAAWLYALYPLAWWRVGFANKEILLAFLLTLTVYLWHRPVASGAVLAILNLCKPSYLLLPLLKPWWRGKMEIKKCLMTFVVMMAIIAPWTVRNYSLSGEFVPVGTERGGFTAYITNWWPTRGDWETNKTLWHAELDRIRAEHPGLNEVQMDRVFYRLTVKNILAEPGHALLMFARKAWMFWFVNASGRLWLLTFLVQFVYVGLAIAGIVQRRPPVEVAAVVLYTWLVHTLVIADVRFALPVMPCVCLMAAWAFRYEGKKLA